MEGPPNMSVLVLFLGLALVAIGILMIIVDVSHPGAFLIIPAAVLVSVGFVLTLDPNLFSNNPIAAALIVIASAFTGAAAVVPIYRRIAPTHPTISTTLDSLQNTEAMVVIDTVPGSMKGKVRVKGEVWSATSDEPISAGQEVIIVEGKGVTLKVRRRDDTMSTAS